MGERRVNRGENTPESLEEGAKTLIGIAWAMRRAGKQLAAKNQPVVKSAHTVGAWEAIDKLQRYIRQLRTDLNNLPKKPPS